TFDQPPPIVSFPRLAPFIRSTAAILFRQNRIRGILAAATALVLLLSPYRSDRTLVGALAGLTAYVAFVGASTLWLVRRQRASITLMSAHGVADVSLMFTVARALPVNAESGWVLLVAGIPLQVAMFQFGVRPAASVRCSPSISITSSRSTIASATSSATRSSTRSRR